MAIIPGAGSLDISPLINATLNTTDTPISTTSKIGTKLIGLTPTLINAVVVDLANRTSVTIQNNGRNPVYVGNTITVDKTTGLYVAPGSTITFNVKENLATPIYGIAYGVPISISVMEV